MSIVRAIIEVPCLSDNYAYLVASTDSSDALVIDPSQAGPVEAALSQHGLTPVAVLGTHHHGDHVGGIKGLLEKWPALQIYAHGSQRVPGQTHDVEPDRAFTVGELQVTPLHVPGHTRGAIAFCLEDAVFTGDTLFVAGCGRLFEGSPAQMVASLAKLAALPAATRMYCGHEYTVQNLRFAATVEPDNEAIRQKLAWARARADRSLPTVPSSIGEELSINPFLRCAEPAVAQRYGGGSEVEVFTAVRRAKDVF